MSRKAFTLIELLVVIAIIAILAAILFPVFAQAKEAAKKTATLSNAKQFGTAAQIYLSDSDDTFPIGYGISATTQRVRWNTFIPFPAGWFDDGGGWSGPLGLQQSASHWTNSMYPYVKSGGLGEVAGAQVVQGVASDFTLPRLKEPYKIGLSYNGLLSTSSGSAVDQPSQAVAFWTGFGKANWTGRALTSPALYCNNPTGGPCRFNPSGEPQPGSGAAAENSADGFNYGDAWFYGSASFSSPANYAPPFAIAGGNAGIVVRADTSAKTFKIPNPGTTSNRDPNGIFRSILPTGDPDWMIACSLPGTTWAYNAFMRPDYDGQGRSMFGACDVP